jgi:NADP-dependent 3-hydroxy acid dehydrogenase YdfG
MTTTALITGGTSGIGRAVANKLAQMSIHVLVVGRNVERGERTIAEIRMAGGQADFISSDLRDASSARQVARRAVELGNGHVDILINNAGVYPFGPTHETTEESFDKVPAGSIRTLQMKRPWPGRGRRHPFPHRPSPLKGEDVMAIVVVLTFLGMLY